MLKRYPLDPTGRSTDNLVSTERHNLTIEGDDIIFPRYGAYFNDSMIVKQGDKTLVFNKDYQLSFFWQDATIKVGKPISMAIQIINNNLIGEVQLTYQVVGGEYQGILESIEEMKKFIPKMHRNVFWDDVINKPEAWVPTRHLHQINDVFGLTPLVLVLEELRRSLENQSVLKLKTVYDRFLKLKQYVESNLSESAAVKRDLNKILSQVDERIQGIVKRTDIDILLKSIRAELFKEAENKYAQRITDLETWKSIALKDIERLTRDLLTTSESINGYNNRIQDIEQKITDLENRLTNSVTRLDSKITQGLESLNTSLTNLSSSLDNVQRTANKNLDVAKEDLISRMNTMLGEERSRIEAKINQLRIDLGASSEQDVTLIDRKIDKEIQDRIAAILEINTNIDRYKEVLNGKREEQDRRIAETESRLTALEEKDKSLERKIDTNTQTININLQNANSRMDQLKQKVEGLGVADISGLDDKISTAINSVITSTEERINSKINTKKTESDSSIQEVDRKVTSLTGDLDLIKPMVTSNQLELRRVEEHFQQIEAKAEQSSLKDTEHDNEIKRIKERVSIVENAQGTGTPPDIQRKIDDLRDHFNEKLIEEQKVADKKVKDLKAEVDTNKEDIKNFNLKIKEEVTKASTENLEDKIKAALDRRIAEEKAKTPELSLDKLNIHPDEANETQIGSGRFTISNIVHMDTSEDKGKRVPFAPTMQYEWTASNSWIIPNEYDGLIAQVYLTTNLKWRTRPDSDNPNGTVVSPSTKVGYIRLKAGLTVQITVGDISSFGTYLTNDGSSDINLVTPSMIMSGAAYPQDSIGKYGKVLVIV